MRILLAGLTLALAGAPHVAADEPARIGVPRRVEVVDAAHDPTAPTHEVVLPADVVARPGESPGEALSRALHGDDTRASGARPTLASRPR
jgi:hypothetical protein